MKKAYKKIFALAMGIFSINSCCVSAAEWESYKLDTLTVEGERTMAGGFVDRQIDFGILGNRDYMEVPANVSSYTADTIGRNYMPTRNFLNVMTNNPSIMVGGASTNNNVELQIRGSRFNTHDMLLNGIPGMMAMGIIPMNWVEKIDTVIGPNVVLSSTGMLQSVSGFVNFVPKKAGDKGNFSLTETYSGDSHFVHDIDYGQRFGKNKRFGIRVNAEKYSGNTCIDNETLRGKDLYVSLDQRTNSSRTLLLLGYDNVNHHGMPEVLNVKKAWGSGITRLPSAKNVVENFMPSWSDLSHSRHVYTFSHEQKIADNISAYFNAGYQKLMWPGYYDQKPILLNDAGDYDFGKWGFASGQDSYWSRKAFSAGVNLDFKTGRTNHRINFGYEYLGHKSYFLNASAKRAFPTGNIYTGLLVDNGAPEAVTAPWYQSGSKTNSSFTVSDTITAFDEKMKVIVGARKQKIETKSFSSDGSVTKKYSKAQVSPYIAALYRLNTKTSVYMSYAEGLSTVSPPRGTVNEKEIFAPVKTKQYEIGAKWDFNNWGSTLSLFNIKEPTGITNAQNYFVVDGKNCNRGIEWNIFGKVAPRLHALGGIMLLDAKYKKTQSGLHDGKRVHGTPRVNATLGIDYETSVKGLSLNARGLYFGKSYADTDNFIKVPAWTRFDLGARYETKISGRPVSLAATVYNVFDRKYWSTATTPYADGMVMLNPGRNYVLSATIHI